MRAILRLHPDRHVVDDLSFDPPKRGTAEVTEAGYVFRFETGVKGMELVFRINRFANDGTRILRFGRTEGVTPGTNDLISCKPYDGKPL